MKTTTDMLSEFSSYVKPVFSSVTTIINQFWAELEAKRKHRYDLFGTLHDFVDLRNIFGKLVSSKTSVGLETAMRLLQMDFNGQVHTSLSDSYNTARILHKLFCTESLDLDFEYINPSKETLVNKKCLIWLFQQCRRAGIR